MKVLFKIYSSLINANNIYVKVTRFCIKKNINIIVPILFSIPNNRKSKKENIIVSLTTFPKRIDKTWIVVESIFRQTTSPKKVVLTLSKLQFSSEDELPKKLLSLKSQGLEIIWTEDDLRSHKKYYYVMQKYPNDIIITVDDDFIYEETMLEKLLEFHREYPDCVITNLGLKKNGVNYDNWDNLFYKSSGPTKWIMPFGGSGVLYPPNSLHPDAFDKDLILNVCPLADDIWLNSMTILNNTYVVKTNYNIYLLPLIIKNNEELYKSNVLDNENNKQIKALNAIYPNIFSKDCL